MADCFSCDGSYFTPEDLISKAVKCSGSKSALVLGGAKLNPFPLPSLQTFASDLTVIDIDGDKYFKAIKGDHLLITGYDFPTGWTKGFPYKSAATIDIFGQTGVPVQSLFQNFDYADTYFCKHSAQILDSNGVETFEPRVSGLVVYSAPLTGADLTTANTYFDVPAKGTAIWVSKTGSDSNAGTEALPCLTVCYARGIAAAGATVYIKSGVYAEFESPRHYVLLYQAGTLKGIGNVEITGTDANRILLADAANITIEGIKVKTDCVSPIQLNNHSGLVVNRCNVNIPGANAMIVWGSATITNSLIKSNSIAITKRSSDKTLTLNTCKLISGSYGINNAFGGTHTNVITNSTYIGSLSMSGVMALTALGNKFEFSGDAFVLAAGSSGTLSIKYSKMSKLGAYVNDILNTTGKLFDVTIENCIADSETNSDFILSDCGVISFKRNKLISGGKGKNVSLMIKTVTVATVFDVSGNLITSEIVGAGSNPALISIGTDATSTGDNLMTGLVYNNKVLGDYHITGAVDSTQHVIPVFWQNKVKVYNNYIEGGNIAIVFKHDQADLTDSEIHHNITVNCFNHYQIKGGCKLKVYNNVGYTELTNAKLIYIHENDGAKLALDNVVKNNILFDNSAAGTSMIYEITNTSRASTIIDYNVFFSTNNLGLSGYVSLAAWLAAGFDEHSINANPLFTDVANRLLSVLSNSPAIGAGVDLGATYDDGLDVSTDWGNDTELPIIVTKQQGASWDIGAYIH